MRATICLLFLAINFSPHTTYATTIALHSDADVSTAGYFQLTWSTHNNTQSVLEESQHSDFSNARQIYQGSDTSTVISGKKNGNYFYRVKPVNASHWSEPVKVVVAHHSLSKAFLFFICGTFIFSTIILVIIKNSRMQNA